MNRMALVNLEICCLLNISTLSPPSNGLERLGQVSSASQATPTKWEA